MARNLIEKGHEVVVHDLNEETMDKLVSIGAKGKVSSPSEVAIDADAVVTMVPLPKDVRHCYADPDTGIFKLAKPGAVLIDSSTIDPQTARELQSQAGAKGFRMIDAPVSGGVLAAEAGNLTFMIGGKEEDVAAAKQFLDGMGPTQIYCGPSGNGLVAKLCNNLMLAISMTGISECMNLGIKMGIDPKTLANVINKSSGRCWASDTYNPVPGILPGVPSARGYTGGFSVDLMAKDLSLGVAAAHGTKEPLPLGSVSHQLYNLIAGKGYGHLDYSSIYHFLQKHE